MMSDHANDQKKLARLLQEIKEACFKESLGEERMIDMSIPELYNLINKGHSEKVAAFGGQQKWNALSEAEQLKADAEMMSAILLKLGNEAYTQLSEEERHDAESFIWAGCAMHKDMNCVKGGNAAMMAWWDENNVPGPMLLPNKYNAPALEQGEDSEDDTETEQNLSSGGGVKLAGLAGMLFNNKNDKIGQQDMHEQFFRYKNIKKNKFPDTGNTQYQSHCTAAEELIKHLSLYIEFMEWIRDGKDRPGFTNMERNIYKGLQDISTQTELVVLVLYAQSISHPYMRQV
jgi:hypothetical protein